MSHPVEILRKLVKGQEYQLIITDLEICKDSFPGSNGNTTYCHFFMGQYSEWPDPVSFQWCIQRGQVSEFKVGDTILVKAGEYVASKNRQSVTWLRTIPKNQKQVMQDIVDNKPAPKGERHMPVNNSNPAVMGSLWSIALGHAIQFNKDKKCVTMKDVLIDAALLESDYNQRFTQVQ